MGHPVFFASIPRGDYLVRVQRLDGSGGVSGSPVTVTIEVDGPTYPVPWSTGDTRSLFQLVRAALQTHAAFSGTWTVTFPLTDEQGFRAIFGNSNAQFRFEIPAGNALPLGWIGQEGNANVAAVNDSGVWVVRARYHTARTWRPRAHLVDYGWTPTPWMRAVSPQSGDGSIFSVSLSGSVGPQWRVLSVDATVGALGARMQRRRAARESFADAASTDEDDPFVALDSVDGFWQATASGLPFVMLEDELTATVDDRQGPYVIADAPTAPVSNAGWQGLREPNVTRPGTSGGRRIVQFSALEIGEDDAANPPDDGGTEVAEAPSWFVSGTIFEDVSALTSAFDPTEFSGFYALVEDAIGDEVQTYRSDGTDWVPVVDSEVGESVNWGSVASVANLPTSGVRVGDLCITTDTGYRWELQSTGPDVWRIVEVGEVASIAALPSSDVREGATATIRGDAWTYASGSWTSPPITISSWASRPLGASAYDGMWGVYSSGGVVRAYRYSSTAEEWVPPVVYAGTVTLRARIDGDVKPDAETPTWIDTAGNGGTIASDGTRVTWQADTNDNRTAYSAYDHGVSAGKYYMCGYISAASVGGSVDIGVRIGVSNGSRFVPIASSTTLANGWRFLLATTPTYSTVIAGAAKSAATERWVEVLVDGTTAWLYVDQELVQFSAVSGFASSATTAFLLGDTLTTTRGNLLGRSLRFLTY